MNHKFGHRISEYLESECGDYGLEFTWKYEPDLGCVVATITRENTNLSCDVSFKYNEENDDLSIELCEDSYYVTREFDHTVKYLWMLIAPVLFPNK